MKSISELKKELSKLQREQIEKAEAHQFQKKQAHKYRYKCEKLEKQIKDLKLELKHKEILVKQYKEQLKDYKTEVLKVIDERIKFCKKECGDTIFDANEITFLEELKKKLKGVK